MELQLANIKLYNNRLSDLPEQKLLISTINAHSYNIAQQDLYFKEALNNSEVLLPDGISIVLAVRFLTGVRLKKIAGADLFFHEMNRLNQQGGKCFFLGSNESTLHSIVDRVKQEFPNVNVFTYSPPYKSEFSDEESAEMIAAVNRHKPDVLFIGMTAPKQEKWAYQNYHKLDAGHICPIGAVFDFYAGTIKRAPQWLINLGLEWLYRLLCEPRRLWRRYLIGNIKFIWLVLTQKRINKNIDI